jgi:peptidoglycan/xylan/chitin deacetylase (PgdA/CDA1 family)
VRRTLAFGALAISLTAFYAHASTPPVWRAEPTGCAAFGPNPPFDVQIVASRTWGVVPFEVAFSVAVRSGADSLIDASWDFDGDGLVDTTGLALTHTFTEPAAREVVAQIVTVANGIITRADTVQAYSAVMSITFDDGQESVHHVAFPLLASRGVTATVYVVPTWMNSGWYLSWQELYQLRDAGWDIGSHTLTHKNLTQVDSVTLHYELSQSKAELQARGFPAKHFSVPFGACSWAIIDAVELYYESCRGWKGLNPPLEETDPYLLMWDVTSFWRTFDSYKQEMDSVMTYGGWYILNNHLVVDDCHSQNTCVETEMLAEIVDYALEHRIKIMNIDQALATTFSPVGPGSHPDRDVPRPGFLELAIDRTCVGEFPVTVRFAASGGVPVNLSVYDVTGRKVRDLVDMVGVEGEASAAWDGRTGCGAPAADGCYFCVLRTGDNRLIAKKLVVVR